MECLTLVENPGKELRDDKQASACAVHAGTPTANGAAAIAVAAKVPGIPKASPGNWVRLPAQGELNGAGCAGKAAKVSPAQVKTARLHAENTRARPAVRHWMAFYNQCRLLSSLGYLSPMQHAQRWQEAQH